MFVLSARTLEWALAKEPLVRQLRPANSSPSIIMDAFDLTINLRGYGWNWSHGLSCPQDTRPRNCFAFALYAAFSAVGHLSMFGICQRAIISFRPPESTTTAFSLFDESLPLFMQYVRASVIVAFQYILSYSSSQASYDIGTIIGVLFFGQEPAQWPPLFDAPWRSTSLTEYWGRRWHQWFRHTFLFVGGYPLAGLIGRPGILIGGFLASAVMHGILVLGGGNMEAARGVFLTLVMMIPLGLAERAFYRSTGKKVGGFAGAIWTVVCVLLSGTILFEGWMKTGAMGDENLIDGVRPVRMFVEHSVKGLDALLHAI